jgi:two-component sensor histidine kinase/PAS domain-containing protein
MPVAWIVSRLSREPQWPDYLRALALTALALLCRAALSTADPGANYMVLLVPTTILGGMLWGTMPAAIAALAGALAMAILFIGNPLLALPPGNHVQLHTLIFLMTVASVLAMTSALRRAVRAATDAQARLAEVFRQIPGAAAILEAPGGRLILRSAQSDTVLGQPERAVASSCDLRAYGGIHPDGSPFAADEYPIVRALKTGEPVSGERFRYQRADGRLVDLEVHAGPVRGAKGEIVAAVGMAFDVTRRADAERRLQESEARYRAVSDRLSTAIDAGALGLWELDLAAQTIRIDTKLAVMLGLPAEPAELTCAEAVQFIDPDDQPRAREVFAAAIATGASYADELRMRAAGNEARWFVVRGVVLPEAWIVVGVMRDVTARRRREEALHAALTARDILMREADHRIKNSLQIVGSLLRLQLGGIADPDARSALEEAITRVNAVAQAHLALQRSPDLRTMEIDRVLADLSAGLAMLNPRVTISCAADTGVGLDAGAAIPLGLIVSELITNAMRHAFPPGQTGQVRLTAIARDGLYRMTIADYGVGLPVDAMRAGLGTRIVAALARQAGATVSTSSEPGQGTAVTVSLPLPAVADCPQPV